jgi:hypothetical protein
MPRTIPVVTNQWGCGADNIRSLSWSRCWIETFSWAHMDGRSDRWCASGYILTQSHLVNRMVYHRSESYYRYFYWNWSRILSGKWISLQRIVIHFITFVHITTFVASTMNRSLTMVKVSSSTNRNLKWRPFRCDCLIITNQRHSGQCDSVYIEGSIVWLS